jgi:Spy/CpxP family protein refolding chaperone
MKLHGLLLILPAAILLAQAPPPAGAPRPGAQARPAVAALKTFLELTDQQVNQLVQLRREEQETLSPIRQQVADKLKALRDALAVGSPDAAAVGGLTLDVRNLRQQVRQTNEDYHNRALGLLDDGQKTKLKRLEQVVRLRPAVAGATTLNLLLPPPQPQGTAAQGQMLRRRLGMRQGVSQ